MISAGHNGHIKVTQIAPYNHFIGEEDASDLKAIAPRGTREILVQEREVVKGEQVQRVTFAVTYITPKGRLQCEAQGPTCVNAFELLLKKCDRSGATISVTEREQEPKPAEPLKPANPIKGIKRFGNLKQVLKGFKK